MLEHAKHLPWAVCGNPFIGVVTDFTKLPSHGEIEMSVKPTTVTKVRELVAKHRAAQLLTPTEAGALRGKSQWCFSYGGIGNVALHALAKRQYSKTQEHAISRELDGSLAFLEALFEGELPKVLIRARDSGEFPTLVLSDASWAPHPAHEFGLGYMAHIVYCPNAKKPFFAWTEMPQERCLHSSTH